MRPASVPSSTRSPVSSVMRGESIASCRFDGHPSRPVLIVEVADSSYRIDRELTTALYARGGVPEYWIVDVAREVLEVHREPVASSEGALGWRYARVETLARGAVVSPLIASAAMISIADLLG